MSTFAPSISVTAKKFTLSTNQAAATYDICTATGGDVYVLNYCVKTGTAAAGLVSVAIQTNNTTVNALLSTTALASLTGDKVLAQSGNGFILESGKKVQGTIVGIGSGGTILVAVVFAAIDAGATLA